MEDKFIKLIILKISDCNFEWIGECHDGWLICKWEEEVLVDRRSDDNAETSAGTDNHPSSLALATHIAIASPDLHSAQVLQIWGFI